MRGQQVKMRQQAQVKAWVPDAPPSLGELEGRRQEAERLEVVGRSPMSSPTLQLVQMVADVGPLVPAGVKPAQKKIRPTMGGKTHWKEFLKAVPLKKPQRYWLGTMVSP